MNKWALVTGASSGIGVELARIYAEQQHGVIVVAGARTSSPHWCRNCVAKAPKFTSSPWISR
ncbi:MAG: SDR family NAD(P)-dependent oxidoreductase [Pseudomonadales bacterium]|nr:SDR family NAD(P)-dependent oxidoreductase [Pseudomonadales bacterium]MDP6469963.1 SDR family NAD(P)-dependent oxidoreductase [Pseudomonadales bacterium]MDP6829130.1 SDR family NAD(P)-dependent oxidoreductase [Pseudomonadales bacterium]